MKYKIGDLVRIKSKEEIDSSLNKLKENKNKVYFNSEMYKLCGAESKIKDSFKFSEGYKLANGEWLWAEEWLEPVHNKPIENDKSIPKAYYYLVIV